MSNTINLDDIQPQALFDIFYESGTQLRMTLHDARRQMKSQGNDDRANAYRNEENALRKLRQSIKTSDKDSQMKLIKRWDSRREEIEKELA